MKWRLGRTRFLVSACAFLILGGVAALVTAEPPSRSNQVRVVFDPERPMAELLFGAGWMTPQELKRVAQFLGAPSYHVAGFETFAIVDASDRAMVFIGAPGFGVTAMRSEVVRNGLLWNISKEAAHLRIGETEAIVSIPSGGLFGIGLLYDEWGEPLSGGSCSVTCGAGYYACCNPPRDGGTIPVCDCIPTSIVKACQSGGTGSTGCSLTTNQVIE